MKDPESDLADLLRGEAALLDLSKKGDIDRVRGRGKGGTFIGGGEREEDGEEGREKYTYVY